jgi:hypothetical protein
VILAFHATCPAALPLAVLLLSLCPLASPAWYYSPPLEAIGSNNHGLASGLEGLYNRSAATGTIITLQFGNDAKGIYVSSSVDPVGFSYAVDGAACPNDGLALLVARGIETEPPGDFDNDGCPESATLLSADYSFASVTFSFRGINESSQFLSTYIPVPDSVLATARDSSGTGNLTVTIRGIVRASYELDNPANSDASCVDNITYAAAVLPIPSTTHSFRVYGRKKLFFLQAPVLREQWFRNNRFDVIVLSQAPIYHAEVRLNNNLSENISMERFMMDNSTGPYGLWEAFSAPFNPIAAGDNSTNQTNSTNETWPGQALPQLRSGQHWSEYPMNSSITPSPLEESSNAFSYAYGFNSSYEGIGANNLSLAVWDVCGGNGSVSEPISSRMLSYGGTTLENGSPIDASISRGSVPFTEDTLSRAEISIGLVAVVLLLSFINYWALR